MIVFLLLALSSLLISLQPGGHTGLVLAALAPSKDLATSTDTLTLEATKVASVTSSLNTLSFIGASPVETTGSVHTTEAPAAATSSGPDGSVVFSSGSVCIKCHSYTVGTSLLTVKLPCTAKPPTIITLTVLRNVPISTTTSTRTRYVTGSTLTETVTVEDPADASSAASSTILPSVSTSIPAPVSSAVTTDLVWSSHVENQTVSTCTPTAASDQGKKLCLTPGASSSPAYTRPSYMPKNLTLTDDGWNVHWGTLWNWNSASFHPEHTSTTSEVVGSNTQGPATSTSATSTAVIATASTNSGGATTPVPTSTRTTKCFDSQAHTWVACSNGTPTDRSIHYPGETVLSPAPQSDGVGLRQHMSALVISLFVSVIIAAIAARLAA